MSVKPNGELNAIDRAESPLLATDGAAQRPPCEDCGLDWCGATCGRFLEPGFVLAGEAAAQPQPEPPTALANLRQAAKVAAVAMAQHMPHRKETHDFFAALTLSDDHEVAAGEAATDKVELPLADAQMLLSWMDETFGSDDGLDWQDEDAAAVGDALNKAIEDFKRMSAALSAPAPTPPKCESKGGSDYCAHCGGDMGSRPAACPTLERAWRLKIDPLTVEAFGCDEEAEGGKRCGQWCQAMRCPFTRAA